MDADLGNKSAEDLRRFVERIEKLIEERTGINDDIKDVKSEAKALGFDPPTIMVAIKQRAMEKHAREEKRALVDTYLSALGLL